MKKFNITYRQYGPMLDGGNHVYTESFYAKTSRGAIGQCKREAKDAFNNNPDYKIEVIKVEED